MAGRRACTAGKSACSAAVAYDVRWRRYNDFPQCLMPEFSSREVAVRIRMSPSVPRTLNSPMSGEQMEVISWHRGNCVASPKGCSSIPPAPCSPSDAPTKTPHTHCRAHLLARPPASSLPVLQNVKYQITSPPHAQASPVRRRYQIRVSPCVPVGRTCK